LRAGDGLAGRRAKDLLWKEGLGLFTVWRRGVCDYSRAAFRMYEVLFQAITRAPFSRLKRVGCTTYSDEWSAQGGTGPWQERSMHALDGGDARHAGPPTVSWAAT
jgi:hypothetical protein